MGKKESPGAALVRKRYEKMTPEERSAAAKNAAEKRWAKAKKAGTTTAKKRSEGKKE